MVVSYFARIVFSNSMLRCWFGINSGYKLVGFDRKYRDGVKVGEIGAGWSLPIKIATLEMQVWVLWSS
jgi:hypothetical protein